MRMDALLETGSLACKAAEMAHGALLQDLAQAPLGRKQPQRGLVSTAVNAQAFQQRRRQRNIARHSALTVTNVNDYACAIDVANLQMKQFIQAQSGGVERGDDGPVLEVAGPVEDGRDRGRVDDIGQLWDAFGAGNRLVEPGSLERLDVEEAECCSVNLQCAGADLALVEQVEQVLPDLLRAEALGRSVEVFGEALDGCHINISSERGEVAELQLLKHAFA